MRFFHRRETVREAREAPLGCQRSLSAQRNLFSSLGVIIGLAAGTSSSTPTHESDA